MTRYRYASATEGTVKNGDKNNPHIFLTGDTASVHFLRGRIYAERKKCKIMSEDKLIWNCSHFASVFLLERGGGRSSTLLPWGRRHCCVAGYERQLRVLCIVCNECQSDVFGIVYCSYGKSGILRIDGRMVGMAEASGVLTSLDTSGNVFIGQSLLCITVSRITRLVRPSVCPIPALNTKSN